MAIGYMNCVIDADSPYSKGDNKWEYSESKATAGNTKEVIIPMSCKTVLAGLHIVTGVGKIQTSISNIDDIKDGNGIWTDWTSGSVSATTEDEIGSVNAIRAVNTSGTIKLVLIAY